MCTFMLYVYGKVIHIIELIRIIVLRVVYLLAFYPWPL